MHRKARIGRGHARASGKEDVNRAGPDRGAGRGNRRQPVPADEASEPQIGDVVTRAGAISQFQRGKARIGRNHVQKRCRRLAVGHAHQPCPFGGKHNERPEPRRVVRAFDHGRGLHTKPGRGQGKGGSKEAGGAHGHAAI